METNPEAERETDEGQQLTPSEPTAHNYQPGQEQTPGVEGRAPAEGSDEVPAPPEAEPE